MKKRALLVIPVLMALFCFPVNAAVSPTAVTTVDAPLRTYDSKVEVRGQAIQYQAYKTDQMVVQQGVQNNGTTINFLYSEYDLWDTTIHCSYTLTNTSADVVTFDSGALYSNLYVMMSDVNAGTNSAVSYQGYYIDNVTNGAVLVSTSNGVNVFRMDNIRSGNQIVILPYQSVSFSYDFHAIWYGVDDGTTSNPNTGVDIQNYTNTVSYSSGGVSSMDFDTFIASQETYEAYYAYHMDQIWTSVQALVSQGVIDQQKYDQIISILMSHPNNITYGNSTSNIFAQGYSVTLYNNLFYTQSYANIGHPIPVTTNFDYNGLDFSSVSLNESTIYVVPTYIEYRIFNRSNKTYSSASSAHWFHIPIDSIILDQGYYYGSDYEVILEDGITLLNLGNDIYFGITEHVDNKDIVTAGAYYRCIVKLNRYFVINKTGDNITRPNNVYINNFAPSSYNMPSFSIYNQTIYHSIRKTLSDIRDYLFGDSSKNDQIDDGSGTISDTSEQQHTQEQTYFDNNSTAIDNAGLQNFEFDTNQVQAIGTSAQMFTNVWNMLGPWSAFIIFILTLRLATFILRHKPKSGE